MKCLIKRIKASVINDWHNIDGGLGVHEKAKGVHYRRQALAFIRHKKVVKTLFSKVAQASLERKGGYTRIIKLGNRFDYK